MAWQNLELLLVILGVFLLPLVLGQYIGRAVRLPEQSWRIATVLFSLFAASAITYYGWPPKLGIDLSGGSQWVYEVDQEAKEPGTKVDMPKLIQSVQKRIDPDGVREVTIRPYGVEQIEIIVPETNPAELERLKNRISSTGLLEFRITANTKDHENIIELAKKIDPNTRLLVMKGSDGKDDVVARWVAARTDGGFESSEYITRRNKDEALEVLVVTDPQSVTGGDLRSASDSIGEKGPKVDFRFKPEGARKFEKLTRANLPDEGPQPFHRHLGIILDGQLYSAPVIQSVISEQGEITGSFTAEQTADLASVLDAGSLPAALRKEPSTSLVTGATLGEDTIKKGVNAMLVSTIAVVVFMIIYYRFAGVVANIALLLNVLLIVACMIMFHAAFTLSGLAGLALTVGMAVDANVLIYERMREELTRGATLRMAIRNGFGRATTTIIDANITTLISAVVLYLMGTDQVKGFAITLILGIVMNLFTAIFVSRVFFDIAEKTRFIKDLKMLHILSNPNFDFIGKSMPATILSLVIIGIGMGGVFLRGKGLLDIDFTGGTSVTLLFEKPIDVADVRDAIDAHRDELPDVTVQDVRIADEQQNLRFVINTSNPEIDDVEKQLQQIFQDALTTNHLEVKELVLLAPAAAAPSGAGTGSADASKPSESADPAEAEKPAEKPVGPTTEEEKAAPADPKSSGNRTRGAADSDGMLLARADASAQDDAPKGDAKPAADQPPAAEDAAPATKTEPASESKSDSEPSIEAKPAEAAPSETAPTLVDRFAGGSKAVLKFTMPISNADLLDELNDALARVPSIEKSNVAIEVDAEGLDKGSSANFETWNVRTSLPPEQAKLLLAEVNKTMETEPYFPTANKTGSKVAQNTQEQAIIAMIASLILILAYVWFRFSQVMFGVAAVVAVIHDVLVTLGALALSKWLATIPGFEFLLVEQFKISLPIIAAFLTIIGYSLNDTIVIFDRIREVRGKSPVITRELANLCINQTLSRTILTSLTVFIVVLILYAVGGQGIHGFAFALVVGVIAGSYSTIYIATPIVLWMNRSATARPGPPPGSASAGKKLPQPSSPA